MEAATMIEPRYRLVKETNGEQHIASLILTADEIEQALEGERLIHEMGGWSVTSYPGMLRFVKAELVRWVWVRSSDPMTDTTRPDPRPPSTVQPAKQNP